ncbi:hypothetical protein ACFE04_029811 [Oxalis oulophora]
MMQPISFRPGWRFSPSDEELVSHYLKKYLAAEENRLGPSLSHIIRYFDVYSTEPWNLPLNDGTLSYLNKNEAYFITPRTAIAQDKENKKRPRRTIESKTGHWVSSATKIPIHDRNTGELIGLLNKFCFYRYLNKKGSETKKTEEKTEWLMAEYELANAPSFNNSALCRIKYNGKPNSDMSYGNYINVPVQVVMPPPIHVYNNNNTIPAELDGFGNQSTISADAEQPTTTNDPYFLADLPESYEGYYWENGECQPLIVDKNLVFSIDELIGDEIQVQPTSNDDQYNDLPKVSGEAEWLQITSKMDYSIIGEGFEPEFNGFSEKQAVHEKEETREDGSDAVGLVNEVEGASREKDETQKKDCARELLGDEKQKDNNNRAADYDSDEDFFSPFLRLCKGV